MPASDSMAAKLGELARNQLVAGSTGRYRSIPSFPQKARDQVNKAVIYGEEGTTKERYQVHAP